ncbi:MAG: hypothetical protein J6A25_05785 [Lachnospiraceae bacterium]|nr:hypothetical protein [Lachnospiraceae bacterium]
MKQYFISSGRCFWVEGEDINSLKIKKIDGINSHIDWVHYISEDGVIRIEDKLHQVKSGDLIITLYPPKGEKGERDIVIISNETWSKNILAWDDYYREREHQNNCECCND